MLLSLPVPALLEPTIQDTIHSRPTSWALSVKVGLDWEEALAANSMPHTRRVALRTSLVMSPQPRSVFAVLSRLARLGLGGIQGRGNQH